MPHGSVHIDEMTGDLGFLAGGGEMGVRIRAFDWSRTALGAIRHWPQSLRTATGIVLQSPAPLVMLWGADGVMIYNDAYSVFAGGRHPYLLGSKVLEGWPEVADFNRRVMEVGLAGGTLSFRDQHLVLHRNGEPEDVWMNLDYSPVRDESGRPAGVLAVVVETTDRVRAEAQLRESRERLGAALTAAQLGAFDWNLETGAVLLDERSRAMFGFTPGEPVVQEAVLARIDPAHVRDVRRAAVQSGRTGEPLEIAYPITRPDGAVRTILSTHHVLPSPEGPRAVGVFADITERRQAEDALHESREAIRAERDRLYGLFEDAPGLVAVLHGPQHVFTLANRAYRALIGDRDVVGLPVREALPEVDEQGFGALLDQVYASGEPFFGHALPTRLRRTPGGEVEERYYDFVYQPIREADGSVSGIFAQGSDVTERTLYLSQQKLLLDELNHRVKNNLATVQAIAQQTARHAPDVPSFRRTFEQRLVALARTHDVLTASAWESADLKALIEGELGPYGETRVRLDGPSVRLTPRQALSLGLVVHELATNAAKYGALNQEDNGCVRVSWTADDGRLELVWRESDGPPVTPPERRGFGSQLIARGVRDLGGEAIKDWACDGLVCRISIPL